jgi:nucleobase:cation symporter-1, NCS1 family
MTLFSHLGGSLFRPSSWALEHSFVSSTVNAKWSNKDMDPVPPHLRTWSTWAYVAYWISDATNLAAWEVASSMLAVGLSWYAIRHSYVNRQYES